MQRILVSTLVWVAALTQLVAQAGQITLEELWLRYQYYPQKPSEFRWMQDDRYYSVLVSGEGIDRYDVEQEAKVDRLLDFSQFELPGLEASAITSYELSDDEQMILLKANVESIYRRSQRQTCMVVDRASRELVAIHGGEQVINPTFSPDGSQLGFVFDNNLYVTDLETGQETQVTTDGQANAIINGLTDWVYEEEFAFVQAFAWSPDGQRIAYYRFDEQEVPEFVMPLYNGLYPEQYTFKYPKAGETNSLVSLHVFDLPSGNTVMVDVGDEPDQYLPRIKWTQSPDELAVLRLNRLQNRIEVLMVQAATGESEVILTEVSNTYIAEATDDKWHFLKDSEDFLWLSEESGYNHLYRYNRQGKQVAALTQGAWEVTSIVGIDEANDRVYYVSTEASPLQRQLYSVSLKGKKQKRLSQEAGHHKVEASSDFTYFVDTYSSQQLAPATRLLDQKGKVIKVLEDNQALQTLVSRKQIAAPEFITCPSADGQTLNGFMIKPADFEESKTYPLLMFVYGGPGSQEVLDAWGHGDAFNYIWFQMLAQQGYLVACVDNRGTGGRGQAFRATTYADLGNLETQDQVAAAKYLGELPYVDADRIGIWGWSYGGYMSSLCLVKGAGTFKMAIAVAPVTNWRFYDTIYTERYLKRPQDNPEGYDDNSPINFARQMKGRYLLVHGTADDNVHFQNSMEWVNALVNANQEFDTFFYPNKAHGISGGITRYHLYRKLTTYVLDNL
jgi:dipeptidyl-peptidase-4